MTYRALTIGCLALLLPLSGCVEIPLSHQAAYDGDTKTVLTLIDQGLDITTLGPLPDWWIDGTMLAAAAKGDRSDTVLALLERGADLNKKVEGFDYTPLHVAAQDGHSKVIQLLLTHGADPNLKGFDGWTPLHLAAFGGHTQATQLLLAHGAVAGIANDDGSTPSRLAEEEGHTTVARLLQQAEVRELGLAQAPASSLMTAGPTAPPVPVSDVDRVPTLGIVAKKNAYAVVIGIEQYREKLPKADFADRDAKLVGEYLTKVLGYPEENVIVRTNERATRTDLVKYFEEWLRNNAEKDSSVFVYYSGHGAPNAKTGEAYFVPYDGDPSFVDSTAYPVKQLYAALDKLPAKDITVVLDSCFSGAGGRSVLAKGARPMGLSMENATLASSRTVVLAASGGDQISNSFEEKGHGLLTYYFLKGLQGEGDGNKDGTIEMAELYDYVKPNVQRIARKQYNNEQTPQLLASPDVLKRGGGRLLDRKQP